MSGDCTSEECRTRYDAMFEACSESGCQINLLERDNAALRAEIEHLRRGIEAYREERTVPKRVVTEQRFRQRLADATDAVMAWEREEAKRDER